MNQDAAKRYGTLLILSGPSGAGKTTVYKRVLEDHPDIQFSVSCTTRPRRPEETDGVDYHFLSRDTFEQHLQAGEFLEHATVHDNQYGTLRQTVEDTVRRGTDILLDIDVQGARQIRTAVAGTCLERAVLFVFCAPPSYDDLRKRLEKRATDDPSVIRRRLKNAVRELEAWKEYDYVVVNDRVPDAVQVLEAIILAARRRTSLFAEEPWKD